MRAAHARRSFGALFLLTAAWVARAPFAGQPTARRPTWALVDSIRIRRGRLCRAQPSEQEGHAGSLRAGGGGKGRCCQTRQRERAAAAAHRPDAHARARRASGVTTTTLSSSEAEDDARATSGRPRRRSAAQAAQQQQQQQTMRRRSNGDSRNGCGGTGGARGADCCEGASRARSYGMHVSFASVLLMSYRLLGDRPGFACVTRAVQL